MIHIKHRPPAGFRRSESAAEQLWRSLNDWLTLADGRFGTPTAYALTHRYVGLPLSQALIRAADRRHLTQMFRQFGLPPGSDLPPADMARMLDTWIQQVPCPASKNLQGLWQRAGAQERIAEVAATELLSWDSSLAQGSHSPSAIRAGDIHLIAQVRRFPREVLQLSFLARMPTASPPEELRILSAEGAPLLEMLPFADGSVRPRSAADIDPKSVAEGVLHLADPGSELEARRHPRRVVPLRRDEQVNAFVECERVQLGEDFLLLIKDEGSLLSQVTQLLTTVARPGFRAHSSITGLPLGWVLLTDVQVLCAPGVEPNHADLNALVPVISSQLSIAGWLKLPGNFRKWSSLCAPEIRAVSQLDEELTLTLLRTHHDSGVVSECREWRSSRGLLLVDLADECLEDGDYELKLDSGSRALQRSILRLRSSDSPDRWAWDTASLLAYDLRTPLGALTAGNVDGTLEAGVQGAVVPRSTVGLSVGRDVGTIWWSAKALPTRAAVPIVIASPDPQSCVVTGAHRMQLPPALARPTASMTSGSCRLCGLVKRYPTWPRSSWKRTGRRNVELDEPARLANLPAAKALHISRDEALDALVHLGGGTASSLERVAAQVDSSSIGADSFRRSLESLGHIDISRNERLDVTAWAIAPPCLAEASDGSFFLSGAWSASARTQLELAVGSAGGEFTYDDNGDGPTAWFVEGLSESQISEMVAAPALHKLLPRGRVPSVVPGAAMNFAEALPSISTVERSLPRIPLPGARRIVRLDLASASWEPVHTATSPGAYRVESAFRAIYVFRSETDVDRQEVAVGSAQLVKHLEAFRMGRPFLGHYPGVKRLAVPLGADLPGLYGLAAVLNSGRLPSKSSKSRACVYHDVTASFASRLFDLLST